MVKKSIHNRSSALANFNMSYEYDVSWNDAKAAIRVRSDKLQ